MVITRFQDNMYMTVRGPETRATRLPVTMEGANFLGIRFRVGTVMPSLPASTLVDRDLYLPYVSAKSFWLDSSAWQFPSYENADTFVDRLVRKDLLARNPVVDAALHGRSQELSRRSVRRHFLQTTGVTQKAVLQIERARYATTLLQEGVSIADAVYEAGYFDQSHLTRSLKYFIGRTPSQVSKNAGTEQMSLLYKTDPHRFHYTHSD